MSDKNMGTISIQTAKLEDGTFGVIFYVTGLQTQKQAEDAAAHITSLFCSDQIKRQS